MSAARPSPERRLSDLLRRMDARRPLWTRFATLFLYLGCLADNADDDLEDSTMRALDRAIFDALKVWCDVSCRRLEWSAGQEQLHAAREALRRATVAAEQALTVS